MVTVCANKSSWQDMQVAERKPLAIHHTLKDEQGGPDFPF